MNPRRPITQADLDVLSGPIDASPARLPLWLTDLRPIPAAILMVAIWAVTFLVIIFRHGG